MRMERASSERSGRSGTAESAAPGSAVAVAVPPLGVVRVVSPVAA